MGAAVTRVVFVVLGALGVGLAGLLVSEALHRRSERRRRVVGQSRGVAMGKPVDLAYDRDAVRNQLGQLGILPFTQHPNGPPVVLRDGYVHRGVRVSFPTAKELDNLWDMVNETPPSHPLRPQGTAVFKEDRDAQ